VEQGILLAMSLSLLRIVHHSYRPHTAVLEQTHDGIWHLNPVVPGAITEPGLVLYRFGAPLYYANANRCFRGNADAGYLGALTIALVDH
jgi:SulP family sulfate permease